MLRRIYQPLLLAATVLTVACTGDGVDAPYRQYLQRLGNTLEIPATISPPAAVVPRLPRPGQLRLATTAETLGTLDFMDLRGCALQATIGKSNSSLGRLARDSQKLLLALEFLQLAPGCIATLRARGENTLAGTLAQAQATKRQQLPGLIFNATLASEEFQAFWRPGRLDPAYPGNTSSEVITALEGISASSRRWLAGDYRADNLVFELQLSAVAAGDGGKLWKALAHQGEWLSRADSMIHQKLQAGPLCRENYRPAAAQILPRVIERFFIEGIQPRAAILGRRYHQLLPPVEELEQTLATSLPPDYRQWLEQRRIAMPELGNHPQQHVSELIRLRSSCPGNP